LQMRVTDASVGDEAGCGQLQTGRRHGLAGRFRYTREERGVRPTLDQQETASMSNRFALLSGSLLAALGVSLGAFAAHGLRGVLGPVELGWWSTAVDYQMWHALGLIGLGASRNARLTMPAVVLAAGTVVFAASLYLMALTGARWLGMITPVGGVLMVAGWLLAAWHIWREW